jgi:hypothetical protein
MGFFNKISNIGKAVEGWKDAGKGSSLGERLGGVFDNMSGETQDGKLDYIVEKIDEMATNPQTGSRPMDAISQSPGEDLTQFSSIPASVPKQLPDGVEPTDLTQTIT